MSYQRRVAATKQNFMRRNKVTSLGIVQDWWDRTEAQMRAALHAHRDDRVLRLAMTMADKAIQGPGLTHSEGRRQRSTGETLAMLVFASSIGLTTLEI